MAGTANTMFETDLAGSEAAPAHETNPQSDRTLSRFDDLIFPKPAGATRTEPLRLALERHGQFTDGQLAGRLFPIACVALEVTQRCNLDCTLCYLSDLAEVVPDVPLDTLLARVDEIHDRFGPNTNVQVTGGDPTLRPIEDLEAVVMRIRALGMRSALFTNGIRADRAMLERLAAAGLNDVSFHVDTTQDRRGYDGVDETALNPVRKAYLERAAGLGLRVNFNTTLYAGNFGEVPALLEWFIDHADGINLASFQMQAETGRGTAGGRADSVTREGLVEMIERASGGSADFDVFAIGHAECNLHASILVAGGRTAPLYGDRSFFRVLFERLARRAEATGADWNDDRTTRLRALGEIALSPSLWPGALRALRASLLPLIPSLLRARRPHRLSFFIHNFMSAEALDRARCESCVFLTITEKGPLSMCAMNADRDAYLMADLTPEALARRRTAMAFKHLKGRLRARAAETRDTARADRRTTKGAA
ncbi:MAG: radical SAM protein [Pseudomonadota bacterium]